MSDWPRDGGDKGTCQIRYSRPCDCVHSSYQPHGVHWHKLLTDRKTGWYLHETVSRGEGWGLAIWWRDRVPIWLARFNARGEDVTDKELLRAARRNRLPHATVERDPEKNSPEGSR